jgi:hypothetical protein
MTATATPTRTLTRADLERSLEAMSGPGITALSKVDEAIEDLAHELLEPLRHADMRPSEELALQEVAEDAIYAALDAAKTALLQRLVIGQ